MRQIIPRTMSTQHPDNVHRPFFAEHSVLGGEDEIQEAFYAYSHLGCDEQMWDFEGKEVDNYVVKKLLANNENFFREKKLGQDVRLTYRVPNPEV
jgi:phosphoenolpyruvate carboxylase